LSVSVARIWKKKAVDMEVSFSLFIFIYLIFFKKGKELLPRQERRRKKMRQASEKLGHHVSRRTKRKRS